MYFLVCLSEDKKMNRIIFQRTICSFFLLFIITLLYLDLTYVHTSTNKYTFSLSMSYTWEWFYNTDSLSVEELNWRASAGRLNFISLLCTLFQ